MLRHAFGDGFMVTWAIQVAEDAVAQVLVGAVEDNLPVIAGMKETVHRHEHGAEVDLPAALEEVRDLVEQQRGMAAVHPHLLRAKAATLADQRHGAANSPHQGDCKIRRFDDGIDVTWRLLDLNRVRRQFGQSQPLRDFCQDLFLSLAIQRWLHGKSRDEEERHGVIGRGPNVR